MNVLSTNKQQAESQPKSQTASTVRATISFPADLYKTLEAIAKKKKVSVAWVVREATEQYVEDKWPLLVKAGVQR